MTSPTIKVLPGEDWWHGSDRAVTPPWWPLTHVGTRAAAEQCVRNKHVLPLKQGLPLKRGDKFPVYKVTLRDCNALVLDVDHGSPTPWALVVAVRDEIDKAEGFTRWAELVAEVDALCEAHGLAQNRDRSLPARCAAVAVIRSLVATAFPGSARIDAIVYPNKVEGIKDDPSVILLAPGPGLVANTVPDSDGVI